MPSDKLTAIIYCDRPQVSGKQFLKYRTVDGSSKGLSKFLAFAAKFPGAQYVNLYDKRTGEFRARIYLQ